METATLRGDAELRRLPAHVRHTLGQMLATRGAWRTLMGRVRRPGTDTALFTAEHVQLVEAESARSGRSETDLVLDEWGTWGSREQRPTVDDLVTLLTELSLYRAADYININVLDVAPMARPTHGPGASEPLDDAAIQRLLADQLRREPVTAEPPAPDRSDRPGLVTQLEMQLEQERLDRQQERQQQQQEPAAAADPGPEPAADIRHFSYCYLEKITNEFDDGPVSAGGCRLGAGAYGTVYLGTCETAERLAVKRLLMDAEPVRRQFRTEVEVMSSFRHANLLELLGFSCDGAHNCLVFSYMSNGSLQDRLACKGNSTPLPWARRLEVAVGTARGVVHLHTSRERPLIHRDIKSANILLDDNFTAKVGDFGLAREVNGGRSTSTLLTSTVLGTSAYMPPEAFRGDVSVKLDTFSFGIVLLELLTGLPPYDETREGFDLLSHVEDHVDEQSLHETLDSRAGPIPPGQADALYQLAVRCTEEKRRRPLMAAVLQQLEQIQ
ncbi:interleukin-1 receptor-associated kinase 4-like isoform X2 [Amphibalanus amphitrite]|uniref:interleukin-1 receptor-associated kinase 4-like isoform X2 n=1 Tax=Amphibalanus amphitrite TaxID=1232801 RepID=UPI001C9180FF|nr:interleukin-1 receptor-associated kinase 4-like isoform X2 [Amphibalanus amphitrite]